MILSKKGIKIKFIIVSFFRDSIIVSFNMILVNRLYKKKYKIYKNL